MIKNSNPKIISLLSNFLNTAKSIISLAVVSHPCNATERTPYFTGIPPQLIIKFGIDSIRHGKDSMKYDTFTKNIEELDKRGALFGFN